MQGHNIHRRTEHGEDRKNARQSGFPFFSLVYSERRSTIICTSNRPWLFAIYRGAWQKLLPYVRVDSRQKENRWRSRRRVLRLPWVRAQDRSWFAIRLHTTIKIQNKIKIPSGPAGMPVIFIHCPYSNPHPPQMGRVWVENNYTLKKWGG
jgi:hypothetical protein